MHFLISLFLAKRWKYVTCVMMSRPIIILCHGANQSDPTIIKGPGNRLLTQYLIIRCIRCVSKKSVPRPRDLFCI